MCVCVCACASLALPPFLSLSGCVPTGRRKDRRPAGCVCVSVRAHPRTYPRPLSYTPTDATRTNTLSRPPHPHTHTHTRTHAPTHQTHTHAHKHPPHAHTDTTGRQWLCLALGKLLDDFELAKQMAIKANAHEILAALLADPVPEVWVGHSEASVCLSPALVHICAHKRAQTPTHPHMHARMHAETDWRIDAHALSLKHAQVHAAKRAHTQLHAPTQTHVTLTRTNKTNSIQVRAAAAYALGNIVGSRERTQSVVAAEMNVAVSLSMHASDSSPFVRRVCVCVRLCLSLSVESMEMISKAY